ncbi:unnamed protein product [Sphagnum jensenii]|uniref:Uncharacterized protein n=1 Tax=Sphagnum jensenii TaxID=128206 RepID=A0ABP1AJR3_9BRYO
MVPKRATPFRIEHALQFGVKVVERDAATKEVVSASCLFCIHFGREENIGSKCSCSANVMYFKKPFRSDMYLRHMTSQHPLRWNEYSPLTRPRRRPISMRMLSLFIATPSNHTLVLMYLLRDIAFT